MRVPGPWVCAVLLSALGPSSLRAAEPRDARVAKAALALRDKLVAFRRDLHMNPELSNREERTARLVAERLRALGVDEVRTGVGRYGVVAVIRGGKPGAVVAARADMDALPIQELNDVPYRSRVAGVKHACGHDVHTSVLLGVAEVLVGLRAELAGTVKLVFQGAEEGPPAGEKGGAALMIEEGALQKPRPGAIFGLHTKPQLAVGQVGFTIGPALASSDRFTIVLHGKKAHGAFPHEGIDTVVVASEVVLGLQTIRSRRLDPIEPGVVTVGVIQGGNRNNIIADEVRLEGTVRALSEPVRARIKGLVKEVATGIARTHGATADVTFDDGNWVTNNEPALAAEAVASLRRALGEAQVVERRPEMGAEDFSAYQRVIPGFYFWLGVGNVKRGITAGLHTPEYDADEDALPLGVRAITTLVLDWLERHPG